MTPQSITEARRALAAGRLSAVELLESVLERIEAANPTLNAYLHVDVEGARAQARAADATRAGGGPLHGIPVCIKDVIDVAGLPTTAGGAGWRREPTCDAAAVARLRAAGAIVVGKGNTNEFAYGADGLNPHHGDCLNPHDPERMAGGSSSGPAVATVTAMALGGLGTDTSGSIRVPASLCGLVGLRPTHGSVPTAGVIALSWSYDAVGPLTRTVRDAAVMYSVLADAGNAAATGLPAYPPSVHGLRIGVAEQLVERADAIIAAGVHAAAQRLTALGAEVVPVRFELLPYAEPMHRVIQLVEASQAHAPWFDTQRDRYAGPVRERLEAGYLMPASRYVQAQQARRLLVEDVTSALDGVDAFLAPATPVTAPRRDAADVVVDGERLSTRAALLACTIPATQLGWPVLSVPIGADDAGLPFGMQIVGRRLSEPLLLRIGAALEGDPPPAPAA